MGHFLSPWEMLGHSDNQWPRELFNAGGEGFSTRGEWAGVKLQLGLMDDQLVP